MKITLNDNRKAILHKIQNRVNTGGSVYIYGAALRGNRVREYLINNGIKDIKEFVVDDDFLLKDHDGVIPLSKFNKVATPNDVLVAGFESYSRYCSFVSIGKIKPCIFFPFLPFPASMNIERCYIDYVYYQKHHDDFLRTYNRLTEIYSQELFICFLEAQINGDVKRLQQLASGIQYFDPIIPKCFDVFVDCGGYTGDTLESAYKLLDKIGHYYIFEPDKGNVLEIYNVLRKLKDKNVTIVEKGVWSEETVLRFSSNNSASRLDMSGDIVVDVTTIDSVVDTCGKQSVYIKMDIEGSEVQALLGSSQLIKKMHPYMAISVYHKRDDLFTIPDVIDAISDNSYDFFLRYYGDSCFCELILYCIPKASNNT